MKSKKESGEKPKEQKHKAIKRYAALSGIGLQMGVTIYLFARLGIYLDELYENEKGWFKVLCVLIGVAVSIYFTLSQLRKINEKHN